MYGVPLTKDDRIPVEVEGSDLVFLVQPITGENEDEYLSIMESYDEARRSEDGVTKEKRKLKPLSDLFNFFVKGWKTKDGKPPAKEFPGDADPARLFNYRFKDEVCGAAINANGLGVEEAKKS